MIKGWKKIAAGEAVPGDIIIWENFTTPSIYYFVVSVEQYILLDAIGCKLNCVRFSRGDHIVWQTLEVGAELMQVLR